ncbi:MAG TPA: cupin domain-containing protein [Bryobacteraceae bacterium]|nr:cupin domain-containing protein [Bryobacteraceae bacterium]
MKRRNFIKAAVCQPFVLGAQTGDFPITEPRVVRAGEDIDSQNRSLGFSHITFKISTHDTGGDFFLFEHANLLPGGPPVHLHNNQEEWFYVMEGEVLVQIGEKRFQLKPGDSVLAPRKVPHAFTAVGATPAKMLVGYSPAGKMEQFFRDNANGKPVVWDAALLRKYDCELIGPPLKEK